MQLICLRHVVVTIIVATAFDSARRLLLHLSQLRLSRDAATILLPRFCRPGAAICGCYNNCCHSRLFDSAMRLLKFCRICRSYNCRDTATIFLPRFCRPGAAFTNAYATDFGESAETERKRMPRPHFLLRRSVWRCRLPLISGPEPRRVGQRRRPACVGGRRKKTKLIRILISFSARGTDIAKKFGANLSRNNIIKAS